MWRYELHPPHLINVATLPCESRNSKNVVLQLDITKQNCIKRIVYASSKWTYGLYKKASIHWQDSARRQFQAGLIGDVGL